MSDKEYRALQSIELVISGCAVQKERRTQQISVKLILIEGARGAQYAMSVFNIWQISNIENQHVCNSRK